ncbi:ion transporter [Chromohalobacter sp. 11-W]|uniref:ion transporter n=1 Tax=Chromohalobacter sp. 11-W TaxID=2994061 RepID=UPI0024697819|nr:ion transporter [Chromohalobacter sp. 11-W]
MSAPSTAGSRRRERLYLVWDIAIVVLVSANLLLLLVDSLFLLPPLNAGLEALAPSLHQAYDSAIHQRFMTIDLVFVSIFLLDVLAGWAVAIAERRYARWFFYPFVHWYDVLGCIPISGFRILRVLRLISLLIRLQRLGAIDIRRWGLYAFFERYYRVLMEELSDRVATRLLSSLQEEVQRSDDFTKRLSEKVIQPRKAALVDEIARRLETTVDKSYAENHQEVHRYVATLVTRTLEENQELSRLRRLPMGEHMAHAMERSLSDVASRVVHEAIDGLRSPRFKSLIGDLAGSGIDAWLYVDQRTDRVTEQVLIETLEMLKDEIAVQRWRDELDLR